MEKVSGPALDFGSRGVAGRRVPQRFLDELAVCVQELAGFLERAGGDGGSNSGCGYGKGIQVRYPPLLLLLLGNMAWKSPSM